MSFSLPPTVLAASYRLKAHDSVDSTNALALDQARSGDAGKLWIVSKRQERGRGRRRRVWETPEGNLAATLLLVDIGELKAAATLGFVAGLSLADALNAVMPGGRIAIAPDGGSGAGGNRFELKWPNDVLVSGAKLAGILLESSVLADGRLTVAIGMGVNIVAYPPDLPYPATSLHALGSKADAEQLFLALSDAWSSNFQLWNGGRGLAAIRDKWLAGAAGIGGEVAVKLDGKVLRGVFETIDEDCRFVIRDGGGERITIAAGDVHFGTVASTSAV